jgi:hypothetical protein
MQEPWNDIVTLFSGANTQAMAQIGPWPFLFLLAVAVAGSLVIAVLYQHFHAGSATGSQLHRAVPLIGLSLTAIFVTVQFSLPLSLGLLGALSIVRFRTPVKEPEEVGFLMVVVAASVAAATFKLAFLGILLAVALAALMLQQVGAARVSRREPDGVLVLSLPAAEFDARTAAIRRALRAHLGQGRVEALSNDRDRVRVSFRFEGRARPDVEALRRALLCANATAQLDLFLHRAR